MSCQLLANDNRADPPGSARVMQVTLSSAGAQNLKLEAEFRGRVPPTPRVIQMMSGSIDAPGSIYTDFLIHPLGAPDEKVIQISSPSPSVGQDWTGDVSEFDDTDPEVSVSATSAGRVLTIVVDLAWQDEIFGDGPFQADVDVVQMVAGQFGSVGEPNLFPVKSPQCRWDDLPVS